MVKQISSWHIGIAAEAFAAGLFARCGYDVSVQYGANQPEYDLIVVKEDKIMKVSVKGSQDGSWGLTQKFKKGATYYQAIDKWLSIHNKGTVYCFVQFKGVSVHEMPRVYLASPDEIASEMKKTVNGRGDTILYERHVHTIKSQAYGMIDSIPDKWKFSADRIRDFL